MCFAILFRRQPTPSPCCLKQPGRPACSPWPPTTPRYVQHTFYRTHTESRTWPGKVLGWVSHPLRVTSAHSNGGECGNQAIMDELSTWEQYRTLHSVLFLYFNLASLLLSHHRQRGLTLRARSTLTRRSALPLFWTSRCSLIRLPGIEGNQC